MYDLIKKLYKIPRSITGNGVRETLKELQKICPLLTIHEVPSGTQVFDWTVPKEWNIRDAWIKDPNGNRIVDFKENNLHIVGYSTPIHKKLNLSELKEHLYTLPDQPDWIPYITSYYQERWGFCISENQRQSLIEGEYEICIESELKNGSLTYGEILIPSTTQNDKEIFLSTYVCHPQMANNELSGPAVTIFLAKWLMELKERKYNYRIFIGPETIGSITYLSQNYQTMKQNIIAGFVLTCVGDERAFSYLESPYANTLADKAAISILSQYTERFITYSFLERGSDERQYCSPGIRLPICSVMRTKYGKYPEYHTSADDLSLVTEKGLQESFDIYQKIISALEYNKKYIATNLCEPQLGKRGLYSTLSTKQPQQFVRNLTNVLTYCDGTNDFFDLCKITKLKSEELIEILNMLLQHNLIEFNK